MNILFLVLALLWTVLGAGVYDQVFGLSLQTITQPPTALQVFGAAWFVLGSVLLAAGVALLARMSRENRALLTELFTALDRVPAQPRTGAAARPHRLLEAALIYHVIDPFGMREAARLTEQSQPKL